MSALIFITACNKEPGFEKGSMYLLKGTGSYTFESGNFIKEVGPMQLRLIENSNRSLTFEYYITSNFDTAITNLLVFEIHKHKQVTGEWASPMEFYPDFVFEGEITRKERKKVIVGEMSFTTLHEYLISDGTNTYPASTIVTATGPFEVALK